MHYAQIAHKTNILNRLILKLLFSQATVSYTTHFKLSHKGNIRPYQKALKNFKHLKSPIELFTQTFVTLSTKLRMIV